MWTLNLKKFDDSNEVKRLKEHIYLLKIENQKLQKLALDSYQEGFFDVFKTELNDMDLKNGDNAKAIHYWFVIMRNKSKTFKAILDMIQNAKYTSWTL